MHAAVSSLVPYLRGDHLIIGKSTVSPGTAAELQSMINQMLEPGQGRIESCGIRNFYEKDAPSRTRCARTASWWGP